MTIRAVFFDVYGTLLRVGPPPADADARWEQLFGGFFGTQPSRSRLEFSLACSQVIARRHGAARACGIPYPEVFWPSVVAEVLPEFARLPAQAQADFVFQQMQTGRTVRLLDGAAEVLPLLRSQGRLLGIASNSQAYTLRELQAALAGAGLALDVFERDLCFWSFEHGFSKPDPHVFQILTARLAVRGFSPLEILMVGDRLDNDIEPAKAHGWQTWHLTPANRIETEAAGLWHHLLAWLARPR
jgi:FMN phosphatase YigB (HAD superfamily)